MYPHGRWPEIWAFLSRRFIVGCPLLLCLYQLLQVLTHSGVRFLGQPHLDSSRPSLRLSVLCRPLRDATPMYAKQSYSQISALQSERRLYREHTINKQSLLKSLSKEKVQGICPKARLPIPLLPLVELELSPAAICWLMAQAKRYSKRLEDVMISAWRYISH